MAHIPKFSFNDGRPIAKIVGGPHDGKILFIDDGSVDDSEKKSGKKGKAASGAGAGAGAGKSWRQAAAAARADNVATDSESDGEDDLVPFDDMQMLEDLVFSELKKKGGKARMKLMEFEQLKHALKNSIEPLDPALRSKYSEAKKKVGDRSGRELNLEGGILQPIPNPDGRECIYASAPSGSGKSTYVGKYAAEFRKMYPKKPIFVFSKLSEDKALDKLKPIRIMIDEELLEEPVEAEELNDSMVIFDDCDTLTDKRLRDAMTSLKNDLLETGRHFNVYTVITSHMLNNGKETRTVLNESHAITVFPSSGSSHFITYCLKNYVGMDPKEIKRLMRLPSRWVTILKNYPQVVLHERGGYFVGSDY